MWLFFTNNINDIDIISEQYASMAAEESATYNVNNK